MTRNVVGMTLAAICAVLLSLGTAAAQSPIVGTPYMTDQPNGQAMKKFPKGIDTVYLVFQYDVDRETEIIVEVREERSAGAVIFSDRRTYTGSGTATIPVKYPGDEPFRDGVYDTIIKFGPQRYITAGWEWVVGDVPAEAIAPRSQAAGPSATVQPPGLQSKSQLSSAAGSTQAGTASTPAASTTGIGGLPVWLLAALGVIALVLLGVIVWAVRGFMTAA